MAAFDQDTGTGHDISMMTRTETGATFRFGRERNTNIGHIQKQLKNTHWRLLGLHIGITVPLYDGHW